MDPRDPASGALFFDALCRAAATSLGCRQALICLDGGAVPRHLWPAAGDVLMIEDALQVHHPVLEFFPGSRFVAAVPIHRDAESLAGTLWVADGQARPTDFRDRLVTFGLLASLHIRQIADAALFRLVAENSADTLIRGSLDGIRRYVSPSIRTLLGYEAHELVGKRARDITHPDDVDDFGRKMHAMGTGQVDEFTTEHRMLHKDGTWVWVEAFVKVTFDEVTRERNGYVVSVRDTSRRKELETILAHNASHDLLTGLPNRALLYERLQHEIARSARDGGGFAVLCVDLDGFKQVNDELGHSAGDSVLAAVGERLVSCVRDRDTVARRGGDEFVVVHVPEGQVLESAIALAQRMIETASVPMTIAEWTGVVGLSVGIAVGEGPAVDSEDLLRAADRAMYEAKAAGRNGYRIASPERADVALGVNSRLGETRTGHLGDSHGAVGGA